MPYLEMFIGGLIGIVLHVLVTVRKINKSIDTETYSSVFKKYWRMDWLSLLISFVALGAAIFISSEYLNGDVDKPMPGNIGALLQYKIQTYLKTTFIVVGYCSDSAVYAFLGSAEAKIKAQIKPDNNIQNP